jgi:DNA repair exonuclease SbcCD nuclease subunit
MTSLVLIGDIHLDKLASLFPAEHINLQLNEVDKAIHAALKEGHRYFVLLGDLCENIRFSAQAECALISFFCKWDGKISIDVILGNHDFAENGVHSLMPFMVMKKEKLFKTIMFHEKPFVETKIGEVPINFSPYPYTDSVKNAINLGHFEVSGSTRDNGTKIKKAHDIGEKDIWGMGHLHTPHSVGNVHYTGTLYQLNFGESLPKGYSILEARLSSGKIKHKFTRVRTNPKFKLINLIVESKSDLKKINNSPYDKYRLISKSSIELPEDILDKFPNVVKTEGFSSKEELKSILEDSFVPITAQNIQLPSMQETLEKYLIETKKATPKQVKRGLEILKEVQSGQSDSRKKNV